MLKPLSPQLTRASFPNPAAVQSQAPPPVTKLPEPPHPTSKKRENATRPNVGQFDGVINLTSDTEIEEERQNLLSSFKKQSMKGKQPQAPNTSTVPTAPMQRYPVVIHDLEAEDDNATDANNPYARYKNN
jgi:hypothetical protein